jgi:hypothetical protein
MQIASKRTSGQHVCQHVSVKLSTVSTSYLGHSSMIAMFAISREVSCEEAKSFKECTHAESLGV